MKEAIQKAIEGGWNMFGFADKPLMTWAIDKYYKGYLVSVQYARHDVMGCDRTMTIRGQRNDFDIKEAFSDPLFWQALGKSEGWEENYANMTCPNNDYGCGLNTLHGWRREQHRFIDWIAEGKEIDLFFKELLNKSS